MERLLVLLALLCTGHAVPQDLSENSFTFPLESSTSHVKLTSSGVQSITATTVCMRYFSSITRSQSLFSLAVPGPQDKAFLLLKPSVNVYRLYVQGTSLDISGLPHETDGWNSVCWTWESKRGLTTLWVNGKRSARNILQSNANITGGPSIILGQEQDSYGGGFDQRQSFVGDITDVHFWDSVISPCQIRYFMEGSAFNPGNLVNWNTLQYSITGSVYLEKSDFDKVTCY